MPRRPRPRRNTTQGRRSRLIIRRIDPFTVLKFSVLVYIALYGVLLVAGTILWGLASNSGVRGNVESFVADLTGTEFRFHGGQLVRSSAIGGAILVLAGTCANVLGVVIYNLISDLAGGIGITVEERVRRKDDARGDQPGGDQRGGRGAA